MGWEMKQRTVRYKKSKRDRHRATDLYCWNVSYADTPDHEMVVVTTDVALFVSVLCASDVTGMVGWNINSQIKEEFTPQLEF